MHQPEEHRESSRRQVIAVFFGGLLLMASLALWIGLMSKGWGTIRFGWINQALGSALAIGGFALVVWAVYVQYTVGRGTPAPKVATRTLVTQGPYAYSRNPMTLGALVLYLGIGFWIGSVVVILLTLFVFGSLLGYIHQHESRELAERFGEEYLEYKKKTPFLLPRCQQRR